MIEPKKKYKIKGNSIYFKHKYGTFNPIIVIEDKDINIWSGGWAGQHNNPACILFGARVGREHLNTNEVWYGHISNGDINLGELVCANELEKI